MTSQAFTVPLHPATLHGQPVYVCMWDQEGRLVWFPVWRELAAMGSGNWGLEEVAEEGASLAPGAAGACHGACVFQSHVHGHLLLPEASVGLGSLEFTCGHLSPWPRCPGQEHGEGWTRRAPSSQGGQPCRPHWSLHPGQRPCRPTSTCVRPR